MVSQLSQNLKRKRVSPLLKAVRKRIDEKLVPINVLDLLGDTEYWLNWTRFFGPISGHDAKLEKPPERYLTTAFCYGCNLGPTQTARSLGSVDRKHISWINERHITEENIQKAIEWIINAYNRFKLPKYWGNGTSASADGTMWDLYEKIYYQKIIFDMEDMVELVITMSPTLISLYLATSFLVVSGKVFIFWIFS